MLLRAYQAYQGILFDTASYWASTQALKTEVDFVLSRSKESLAIEVKSSGRPGSGACLGLLAIGALKNVTRRTLVYAGQIRDRTTDGIELWPFDYFLAALAEKKLRPSNGHFLPMYSAVSFHSRPTN